MKLFKRLVLASIAVLVLLGLVAYFTIKIAFPPQKIRQLIHDQGTAALGRDVSVGDVSIRLFPSLMVSIQEINLANAPGYSKDAAIKLHELILRINLISLFKLSPDIEQIKLVNPEILFEVSADGHNNLEGLGGSKKEAAPESNQALELPAAVALRSFIILDGRVRYHELKSGRELALDRINQTVSLELDPALRNAQSKGHLEIAEIKLEDPKSGLRKGNIRIAVKHDIRLDLPDQKLKVKTLEISFQDVKANLEGEITDFQKGPIGLDLHLTALQINLGSLLKEVPPSLSPEIPKLTVSGNAELNVQVKGHLDSTHLPLVTGLFALHDGKIAHADLPVPVQNLNIALQFLGDTLALKQFALDMGGNPVRMEARLHAFTQAKPVLDHFQLNAAVELAPLASLAQRMGVLDEGIALAGLIKAQLEASGPLDPKMPEAIRASGVVDMKGLSVKTSDIPVAVELEGQTRFDNDKVNISSKVKMGKSDVGVVASVRNWQAMALPKLAGAQRAHVKVEVKSSNLDLDELKPKTAAQTEEVPATPLTHYPKLPPVDADLVINLQHTKLLGLDMTAFNAKVLMVGAPAGETQVTSDLKGQLYAGSFNSGLKVNLKDSTHADIGLKLNVIKVEANDFISRLNDQIPGNSRMTKALSKLDSVVFGKFNLNLDVQTSGLPQEFMNNLAGAILFAITDGKLLETGLTSGLSGAMSKVNSSLGFKSLEFGEFKGDLAADHGKLILRNAQVSRSPIGSFTAKGTIGLDNSLALNLDQALPTGASQTVLGATSAVTSQLAKWAKVPELGSAGLFPKDAQGHALLYFIVGGNLTHPEFSLDAKRMATEANAGTKSAMDKALQQKRAEAEALLRAEKSKLEGEAKAKLEEEKKKLQAQADAEKAKAKEKAKDQGKKVLKNLGF